MNKAAGTKDINCNHALFYYRRRTQNKTEEIKGTGRENFLAMATVGMRESIHNEHLEPDWTTEQNCILQFRNYLA